jgi:cytochrome c oxidase cbb3-type subunit IV
MFKDFIKEQAGVQFYPIISLVVFILFFVALTIKALMYKKEEMQEMSSIPFDNETNDLEISQPINKK